MNPQASSLIMCLTPAEPHKDDPQPDEVASGGKQMTIHQTEKPFNGSCSPTSTRSSYSATKHTLEAEDGSYVASGSRDGNELTGELDNLSLAQKEPSWGRLGQHTPHFRTPRRSSNGPLPSADLYKATPRGSPTPE